VFLVVDGHTNHRAKKVREFVAATDGQLRIFTLPGYAPELNPDEWVWNNVKADRIGRAGITPNDAQRRSVVLGERRSRHQLLGRAGSPCRVSTSIGRPYPTGPIVLRCGGSGELRLGEEQFSARRPSCGQGR
jgi:transposase